MKKKVLIIGNSANAYSTAKIFSENCEVHVIPGSDTIKDFAICSDIRPSSGAEIVEYALENAIDLTIPVCAEALDADLTSLFEKNNLQIFAPPRDACNIASDIFFSKKLFYKLRIPTPKFGIFEKQNVAADYLKSQKIPFVIKTNAPCSAVIHSEKKSAVLQLDSIFAEKGQKALVEDYLWGTPFGFYAITDGFKALPIGSSVLYKHSLEGDGGQLTSGMGACVPNYKLSDSNEEFLINYVIYPILEYMESSGTPYCGILGINGILSEDGKINVLSLQTYMQDADCHAILQNINCNLFELFESCANGTFSDDVNNVELSGNSAVSVVLTCRNSENKENPISGNDYFDDKTGISYFPSVTKNKYLELSANNGQTMVVTAFGGSVSIAANRVFEAVSDINFEGKKFRKDICKTC